MPISLGDLISRPFRRAALALSSGRARRRGFNLLDRFDVGWSNRNFEERDFAWIAELGFDYVRIPLDYRTWTDPGDWRHIREPDLREIDRAVELGRKHGVHVCLAFHRAPGYTIATVPEPRDLWTDPEAQDVCALHWRRFAERFAGRPASDLSFNLLNEPKGVGPAAHRAVIVRLVETIRSVDPSRPIVCDGREAGAVPAIELLDLDVTHGARGYQPFRLTHHRAEWVRGADAWPVPAYWPLRDRGSLWDRKRLWHDAYSDWVTLERLGARIFVAELGAYRFTPHAVVLAWMTDLLALFRRAGWGWALWNFRGPFGILDSDRADVRYEPWRGHRLDRALLEVLRADT